MKFISWNVNGVRACLGKGLATFLEQAGADIVALQEIKAQKEQVTHDFTDYPYEYWYSAEKKGYSGTLVLTKEKPEAVFYGIGQKEHDQEGRVLTLEFSDFYFINVYTPNVKRDLSRLPYREVWDQEFLTYMSSLEEKKPIVVCGDLNVAHQEIDLKNPNSKNAGFTPEERAGFDAFIKEGFVDSFRFLHPGEPDHYTWWSYRTDARSRNVGWRIDYFLISPRLLDCLEEAKILPEVMGSDHCPIHLKLQFV